MSRFIRQDPATTRQLYRFQLRCMHRSLATALLLLLLTAGGLIHWRTCTSHTCSNTPGSATGPALRIFSIADTWHASATHAQLPPPPPLQPAPEAPMSPIPAPPTILADLPPLIPPSISPELHPPKLTEPDPPTNLLTPEPARPSPSRVSPSKRPITPRYTAADAAPPAAQPGTTAAPLIAARYRSAPPPPYPATLRAQRLSGNVGVLISINTEGKPTSVTITHSSGHPEFDHTARRWILKYWSFHPATRNGIPQPSQVRTSIRFILD